MKKTNETKWTKLISIRLEWETIKKLDELTQRYENRNMSLSNIIRKAVDEYLEKEVK